MSTLSKSFQELLILLLFPIAFVLTIISLTGIFGKKVRNVFVTLYGLMLITFGYPFDITFSNIFIISFYLWCTYKLWTENGSS